MAEIILVLGRSGSGKSTSLSEIDPTTSIILRPNKKPLPFGDHKWNNVGAGKKSRLMLTKNFSELSAMLDKVQEAAAIKNCFIEDFSHFFVQRITSNEFSAQGKGNGVFERYNALAKDVMDIISKVLDMRDDLRVFIMHHTESDETGYRQFRVFGKLLGEKMDPVSYTRTVLHARVLPDKETPAERYVFQTNDDGSYQAKSPAGMFDAMFIPNNMNEVIKRMDAFQQEQINKK